MGLDPLQVPPHVFGIDRETLRYARFAESLGEMPRLLELKSVDLPTKTFPAGPIGGAAKDPTALARVVGDLVARIDAPIREASLVLPDAWMRLTFVETEELPRSPKAREDVLRWKLKRLVPFRVEDLRLATTEVEPLPGQSEAERRLVAFGSAALLDQLESLFELHDVRLGQITNASSASLTGVRERLAGKELVALVIDQGHDYTVLFAHNGVPLLSRYKARVGGTTTDPTSVARDLSLTRAFLLEHLAGMTLEGVVLVCQPDAVPFWQAQIEQVLGLVPQWLTVEVLGVAVPRPALSPLEVAPLFGAWREAVH